MVKNEQSRNLNQTVRPALSAPIMSFPPPTSSTNTMLQTTQRVLSQRVIDPNAIDIRSIKGQFAWEKLPQCDTYMPVVFRGDTKYFCVRMLRKLLPGYPEDFIRRAHHFQYRKPIDVYSVTASEVDLLNRINIHHARWAFARQPFNTHDELVRVSDFLPLYEHLRHSYKVGTVISHSAAQTLRQLLPQPQPQPQPAVQRSSEFLTNMPIIACVQSEIPQDLPVQMQTYRPSSDFSRENTSSISRPMPPVANVLRPLRTSKPIGNPYAVLPARPSPQTSMPQQQQQQQQQQKQQQQLQHKQQQQQQKQQQQLQHNQQQQQQQKQQQQQQLQHNQQQQQQQKQQQQQQQQQQKQQQRQQQLSIPTQPSITTHSTNTVSSNHIPTPPNMTPVSLISSTGGSPSSSSLSPIISSSTTDTQSSSSPPVILSLTTRPNQKASASLSTTATNLPSKSCLHSGWLQINKLYTPYVSTNTANHHLYKIPVSLLAFYDLLKPTKNDLTDSKDSLVPYAETRVSAQEIELINELCIRQSIKPFAIDTKLITLSTFYEHTSANILFVKELPVNEPKTSICKDWSSVVQIVGGICRLRNMTTLNEQTVPFIGNNLLKNFILSPQCLSTASLSKPTAAELEFLQLILFFSNMSINLNNAQLIDIESVQKEYNVDLILYFNDKFPLNVLNYQQQGNRSNTSECTITSTTSSATNNTIAESTPPPSPPSPPTVQPQTKITTQLPLTSSTNRYYKTIQFQGHSITAYVCSGLASNSQRECVSIKSLCTILYPNSTSTDKLETKMLRILRSKNINRFRPQNQQSIGFTRLIDVKDAEKYWSFIEKEMRASFNNNDEVPDRSSFSSVSNESPKASTNIERVETEEQLLSETSAEVNKGTKRSSDETFEEEDLPISERINKRVRLEEKENHENLSELGNKTSSMETNKTLDDNQTTDNNQNVQSTVENTNKRKAPSTRTKRKSKAAWVRKYNIEDCCIQLDKSDLVYDLEGD